jgi:hypothetical protein
MQLDFAPLLVGTGRIESADLGETLARWHGSKARALEIRAELVHERRVVDSDEHGPQRLSSWIGSQADSLHPWKGRSTNPSRGVSPVGTAADPIDQDRERCRSLARGGRRSFPNRRNRAAP